MARYGTRTTRRSASYHAFRRKERELMDRWAAGLACHSCGGKPYGLANAAAAQDGKPWTCGCGYVNAREDS